MLYSSIKRSGVKQLRKSHFEVMKCTVTVLFVFVTKKRLRLRLHSHSYTYGDEHIRIRTFPCTTVDQVHSVDWNEWYDGGDVEHIIDVCSSNNNHPTNSVRTLFEAQDIKEMWTRYNVDRISVGGLSNGNARPALHKIKFNVPVLCENNNYVRLFRNGNSTALINLCIGVLGYY